MPGDLARVAPQIQTLAAPEGIALLAARGVVQRTPEIREIFARSRDEGWSSERLAFELEEPLQTRLECDISQVLEVARYLADEYRQIGDKLLLIDRTTGKAIGFATEDDLWQPPPVPREGGGLATPLPRLKPEIEAALVLWHHTRGHEEQLTHEIALRTHQTELLRQDGDRRLWPITRSGRARIVVELRELLPELLKWASGSSGWFLRHFELRETDPPAGTCIEPLGHMSAIAQSVVHIQDAKSMNLRSSQLGLLCGAVQGQWVRMIARQIGSAFIERFNPSPRHYTSLTNEDTSNVGFWVANPDVVQALQRDQLEKANFLVVENAPLLGLKKGGFVGYIVIDKSSYACHAREIYARWEVVAQVKYTLWIDWDMVRLFVLEGVPVGGVSVLASHVR